MLLFGNYAKILTINMALSKSSCINIFSHYHELFVGHSCLLGNISLFINIAKQNPKKNLSEPSSPHLDPRLGPFDTQEV